MDVKIEPSWKVALFPEFSAPYFQQIVLHLRTEKALGQTVYPAGPHIFSAFAHTPFHQVKVVLLGQDPYHGPGQAMGLSFSVPQGVAIPPSLQNIYKELRHDVGMAIPKHGNLTPWAQQGVLLLNAALTVKANLANSHAQIGWHQFTNAVISTLSQQQTGLVFLLWGSFAQAKQVLIDQSKHFVLKAPHPSPLSAHKGFLGCGHFSKTNQLLMQVGKNPIDWQL
ncbi:MAG: uracil-DNA glycosylase [Bacteroidetes bacterium]|nr:MAG: uracil-DNA glycosylase [Bacteroidota bacterium]